MSTPGQNFCSLPGTNATTPAFAWGETCDPSGADATQLGWRFDAEAGTLRAADGKCLTYGDSTLGYGNSALLLEECGGSAAAGQAWKYDASKRAFTDVSGAHCLDLFGGQDCAAAPRANLFGCNGGKNQQWGVVAGNGTVVDACGACLGTKAVPPPGAAQPGGARKLQLWAKPQPQGRVAALVINNSPTTTTYDITFGLLNLTSPSGSAAVRDIWQQRDAGTAQGGKFTVTVAGYDSAFLLFAPS